MWVIQRKEACINQEAIHCLIDADVTRVSYALNAKHFVMMESPDVIALSELKITQLKLARLDIIRLMTELGYPHQWFHTCNTPQTEYSGVTLFSMLMFYRLLHYFLHNRELDRITQEQRDSLVMLHTASTSRGRSFIIKRKGLQNRSSPAIFREGLGNNKLMIMPAYCQDYTGCVSAQFFWRWSKEFWPKNLCSFFFWCDGSKNFHKS